MRLKLLVFFLVTFCSLDFACFGFELENKSKKVIDVDIISVNSKEVNFLRNNRSFSLSLGNLTQESKEKLLKYAKENNLYKEFQDIKVDVVIKKRSKNKKGSHYLKTHEINPSVNIEGVDTFAPLPDLKGVMIILGMDTKAKYVDKKLILKVLSNESIRIPEVDLAKLRKFDFKSIHTEYDLERDYTNLGGHLYRYHLFILVNPKDDKVVFWETNYSLLESYINNDKENIYEFIDIKKNSNFPTKFDND